MHYYLAAQAKEWLPTFTSTDGVGFHKSLVFESGGVNFAPVGDIHWIRPNGAGRILCECMADTCFSASEILTYKVRTDKLEALNGKEIITVEDGKVSIKDPVRDSSIIQVTDDGIIIGDTHYTLFELLNRPKLLINDKLSPMLTAADAANIGDVIYWPKFEIDPESKIARAKDFPGIYLATDGGTFDSEAYPKLYDFLGTNELPLVDYCVIRAKELIDD